jgi:hypothetical protein
VHVEPAERRIRRGLAVWQEAIAEFRITASNVAPEFGAL